MKMTLSLVAFLFLVGCNDSKTVEDTSSKTIAKTTPVAVVQKKEVVKEKQEAKKVVEKKVIVAKVVSPADGSKLFAKCAGCHGNKAQNHALGKSQIIAGWSEAKITTALNGYKKGTYGGSMQAVMKGQASKLSSEEVKALAKYISTL